MYIYCARRGVLIYYGRVAAFLVGLLFRFVNEHLDEPVEMVSFPPRGFGFIAATFCNTCVSQLRFWFNFILIRFESSFMHFRCTDRNGNFAVLV